jgi:hypothetical protein
LPPIGPTPTGTYLAESLWWRHEKLHRAVLLDYAVRSGHYVNERDDLENRWIKRAMAAAGDDCWSLTRDTFGQARRKTDEWIENVQLHPISRRNKWSYRLYWEHQNARAGIDVR